MHIIRIKKLPASESVLAFTSKELNLTRPCKKRKRGVRVGEEGSNVSGGAHFKLSMFALVHFYSWTRKLSMEQMHLVDGCDCRDSLNSNKRSCTLASSFTLPFSPTQRNQWLPLEIKWYLLDRNDIVHTENAVLNWIPSREGGEREASSFVPYPLPSSQLELDAQWWRCWYLL